MFPDAPSYHPLPVHVEKTGTTYEDSGDFLRAYSPENCPNQDQWESQNIQNKNLDKVFKNEKMVEAIKALEERTKKNVTFQEVGKYYDNY